ncbi:MAG: hypothetical protein QOH21_43 [Acidobacteriota bacterium]|jgi:hypothetical protein|nr:hypothetical protein [Acidobacteriota bacterium]
MEPTAPPPQAALTPRPRRSPLRLLLIPLLLVAVFFAGWVPPTLKQREANERLRDVELQLRLLTLERRLGLSAAEARRGNFGIAASEAGRFFDDTQRLLAEEPFVTRPRLRTALTSFAGRRDEIVTRLATNDPSTAQLLTDLYVTYDGVLQRGL